MPGQWAVSLPCIARDRGVRGTPPKRTPRATHQPCCFCPGIITQQPTGVSHSLLSPSLYKVCRFPAVQLLVCCEFLLYSLYFSHPLPAFLSTPTHCDLILPLFIKFLKCSLPPVSVFECYIAGWCAGTKKNKKINHEGLDLTLKNEQELIYIKQNKTKM